MKEAYARVFKKINQTYKSKAAHWNIRILNLEQTHEKVLEDLTPLKGTETPITPNIRIETFEDSYKLLSAKEKIKHTRGLSHEPLVKSNRNDSPRADHQSSAFNATTGSKISGFGTSTTDTLDPLFPKEMKAKRISLSHNRQRLKTLQYKDLEPFKRYEEQSSGLSPSSRSNIRSKFSIVDKSKEEFTEITRQSPIIEQPTLQNSIFQRLIKEKLFIKEESMQKSNSSSAYNIRADELDNFKKTKPICIDLTTPTSNYGKDTKKDFEASCKNFTTKSLRNSQVNPRMSLISVARKEVSLGVKYIDTNSSEYALPIFPTFKSLDSNKEEKVSQASKQRSKQGIKILKQLISSPTIPVRSADVKKSKTELTAMELGSPFSRKKVVINISVNQLKTESQGSAIQKEKKYQSLWESLNSIKDLNKSKSPEKDIPPPFHKNRTIATSKHNMFRPRPVRAHLATNYSTYIPIVKEISSPKRF